MEATNSLYYRISSFTVLGSSFGSCNQMKFEVKSTFQGKINFLILRSSSAAEERFFCLLVLGCFDLFSNH